MQSEIERITCCWTTLNKSRKKTDREIAVSALNMHSICSLPIFQDLQNSELFHPCSHITQSMMGAGRKNELVRNELKRPTHFGRCWTIKRRLFLDLIGQLLLYLPYWGFTQP